MNVRGCLKGANKFVNTYEIGTEKGGVEAFLILNLTDPDSPGMTIRIVERPSDDVAAESKEGTGDASSPVTLIQSL